MNPYDSPQCGDAPLERPETEIWYTNAMGFTSAFCALMFEIVSLIPATFKNPNQLGCYIWTGIHVLASVACISAAFDWWKKAEAMARAKDGDN